MATVFMLLQLLNVGTLMQQPSTPSTAATFYLTTESGVRLTAENGNRLVTQ